MSQTCDLSFLLNAFKQVGLSYRPMQLTGCMVKAGLSTEHIFLGKSISTAACKQIATYAIAACPRATLESALLKALFTQPRATPVKKQKRPTPALVDDIITTKEKRKTRLYRDCTKIGCTQCVELARSTPVTKCADRHKGPACHSSGSYPHAPAKMVKKHSLFNSTSPRTLNNSEGKSNAAQEDVHKQPVPRKGAGQAPVVKDAVVSRNDGPVAEEAHRATPGEESREDEVVGEPPQLPSSGHPEVEVYDMETVRLASIISDPQERNAFIARRNLNQPTNSPTSYSEAVKRGRTSSIGSSIPEEETPAAKRKVERDRLLCMEDLRALDPYRFAEMFPDQF